jgi:phage terminase large subunit GpA-like protein
MAAFSSWEKLVLKYLRAEEEYERSGDQGALKTTINTDQGLPYATRGYGSVRLPEDLKQRQEDFGFDDPTVPEGVRFLIATIDVQGHRFVVQIHGVVKPPRDGTMFDTIVIDRFNIRKSKRKDEDGDTVWVSPRTYLEDWELITEKVINASYLLGDDSGRKMSIKTIACDSGGSAGVTSMAYQYWLSLSKRGLGKRFMLVKGLPRPSAPRVEVTYPDNQIKGLKPSQTGQIPVLMINSNKVKDHLNNVLDRLEAGGMIRFSDLLKDSFYAELTVESCDENGKWSNPRKLRNESWDLLYYFFAVCFHLRIEYIDWECPPTWAEEWDSNSLVFGKEKENELKPKPSLSSIESLGSILG